jgi:hypothetical protein
MPGPGPRGERDGTQVFHVIAMFFGVALVLLAVVAVVLLLWNSFRVRAEVRALRGEVARLGSGGRVVGTATAVPGVPAAPASATVNTGTFAVPPSPPSPPAAPPMAPPTSPPSNPLPSNPLPSTSETQQAPAAKAQRAPGKKPTDPVG